MLLVQDSAWVFHQMFLTALLEHSFSLLPFMDEDTEVGRSQVYKLPEAAVTNSAEWVARTAVCCLTFCGGKGLPSRCLPGWFLLPCWCCLLAMASSPCRCVVLPLRAHIPVSLLMRIQVLRDQGLTLLTSFTFVTSLKVPTPNATSEVRAPHTNF